MKNKTLAFLFSFSTVILPMTASAGLTNEVIRHEGIIAIPGAASIKLEQHAGRAITLNKGLMEIRTTKVPLGFSILDPQLVLKQNGQTLYVDIPSDKYSDEETFTVFGKDTNLNYDLYLRKSTTSSQATQSIKTEVCSTVEFGNKCGIDFDGKYDCVAGLHERPGVQQVRNTIVDITTTYKLTLGQNNVLKAEFTSSKTNTVVKSREALSVCK